MSFESVGFEARVGQEMDTNEARIVRVIESVREIKRNMNNLKTRVTNETGFGAARTAEITTRISEMKTLLLNEVNNFDQ